VTEPFITPVAALADHPAGFLLGVVDSA